MTRNNPTERVYLNSDPAVQCADEIFLLAKNWTGDMGDAVEIIECHYSQRPAPRCGREGEGEMKKRTYVRDNNGYAWYYDPRYGTMTMVGDDTLPKSQRGYYCDGLEDGCRLLNKYGYISGKEKGKKAK